MLLNIYIGTTVISWITVLKFFYDCNKKLKQQGYKGIQNIEGFISYAFTLFTPLSNILCTIALLLLGEDEVCEQLKLFNMYIPIKENSNNSFEILPLEAAETYTENREEAIPEKKDDDITSEEKIAHLEYLLTSLEHEKEILINQTRDVTPEPIEAASTGEINQGQPKSRKRK